MDAEHPLRPIVESWLQKIKLAKDYKKQKFGDTADECMAFYNGPHDFMWKSKYMFSGRGFISRNDGDEESVAPSYRFTMNKVAELVQLFGPALYHRNPTRRVNPRENPQLPPEVLAPPLPPEAMMGPPSQQQAAAIQQQMQLQLLTQQMAQEDAINAARAQLLEKYLNYTPIELDLKKESRRVIDEALIKGMGCWWTEVYQPKGSAVRLVGSFYDSVDNVLLDPDVEVIDDCTWIARRCCHPIWEVEDDYGFERDALREYVKKDGLTFESFRANGENSANAKDKDNFKKGDTNDILVYWKIYSKMGMGDRLTGVDKELQNSMDEFGDNCFLVVAEGVPFPLNLPSSAMLNQPQHSVLAEIDPAIAEQEAAAVQAWKDDLFQRVQWPIPFWADGSWPVTMLTFHEVPNCVWPMSHVAPALGELKWLNWAMSFLASKVRTSCKTTIGFLKAAGEDLKQQYLNGGDNAVLELSQLTGKSVSDVVTFLQQPPFHGDIYNVISAVTESFEKRVGLTELAYGQTSSAYRSAAEANVKQGQFSIRPEDMANQVEDSMSDVARKEAIAARWLLTAEDVAPVLGAVGAQAWGMIVQSQELEKIVREFDYRIEAGSVRKPNKQARVEQMQQAVQVWGPFLQQYTFATGDIKPIQAMLDDWCRSLDIDPDRYAMIPPMPPPPPGQEEQGGPPKEQAA